MTNREDPRKPGYDVSNNGKKERKRERGGCGSSTRASLKGGTFLSVAIFE